MYSEIIDQLESRAAAKIKEEPGDYTQNGLLYCGKCRTQKQVIVTIFGKERKPFCLCKCAQERLKAEQEEERERLRQLELDVRRTEAFPDQRFFNYTFEKSLDANETGLKAARKFVEKFDVFKADGRGLLFFGGVGTGKTYLAACIGNALIDRGYTVLMTSIGRMVNALNDSSKGKQQYLDGLNTYDLLIIDDLAAERDTEYMNEQVYTILDARLRSGLPLVITTNLTADDLKHPQDVTHQRLYSRLYEMCIPIEISGKDRRRSGLAHDFTKYKDLLGL